MIKLITIVYLDNDFTFNKNSILFIHDDNNININNLLDKCITVCTEP